MRIALITSTFPNLNETWILDQITGLLDRGHEVDIFATTPKDVPKTHAEIGTYNLLARTVHRESCEFTVPRNPVLRVFKGSSLFARGFLNNPRATMNSINVFRYGRPAISLSALYKAAPFLARSSNYDIVHSHSPDNGELAAAMRDLGAIKGKIVTSLHGYNIPQVKNGGIWQLYKNLEQKGELFLACSEHMKRWFDGLGWGGRKILVHRCAVRLGLFSNCQRASRSHGAARLLSVGRFVEKKGFAYAIAAVAKILQRFPNIEYQIVGDGGERRNLERLISELGIGHNVTLLGWRHREELMGLYRAADIFLAPSVTSRDGDQEGIPVVLYEAMAAGLPVISTHHTGIPEVVHDAQSGFLVPERDPDAVADKLVQLLEHPETRFEMGHKGRKHIEQYNDCDKQTDRLLQIYQLLLEKRCPFSALYN
jgi:colanic acid/amylovoran biosynthesis glycosyltransferase